MGAITKAEKRRREELAKSGLKVCSHCKRELPFDCFCNDKTQKDGLSNRCRECRAVDNKQYNQDNEQSIKMYKRQYRKNNQDSLSEYQKKYNREHAEDIAKRQREYRESNRDQRREITKKWRINNPDKIQAYNKSERVKMMKKSYRHKRRALLANTDGYYTSSDVENLLLFFDHKCAYTGEPLEKHFHLDHVVPIIDGGTNYICNIVPSNPGPNLSKNSKNMEKWFRSQEYFSEERLNKIYKWMDIKQ